MPFVQSQPEGNLGQFPWPRFEANSAVGNIANAIAANRIEQQQNVQKTLAGSIQEMQAQQAANKALETASLNPDLPDVGTLQGQGISGLGAYTELAKLINERKKADELTTYRNALLGQRTGDPREWTDSQGNVHIIGPRGAVSTPVQPAGTKQYGLLGKQASSIEEQLGNYALPADVPAAPAKGFVMNPDGTMRYQEPGETPDLVSPGDPLDPNLKVSTGTDPKTGQPTYPQVPPTFTRQQYQQLQQQSAARQKLLQQQQTIANQAMAPTPGAGQGGGSPALSPQDQQALDWAQANPNDPRAAQIQARLGYGGG